MSGEGQPPALGNPFWPGCFPDPFVLKVRGRYYAYATERRERPSEADPVFPILSSPDLVHWHDCGRALPALGAPFFRYWAPEVTAHNGRFLLYYAVHTDEFKAGIRVAVAGSPEGPFADSGHDLSGALFPWAIDPHVFRDRDGRWYLFMTVEFLDDPEALTGVGNVVVELRDPFTAQGTPVVVTRPRHPWQLFEARRPERGGVDWYCVEGPAVLHHRRRYYALFSGGCYHRDNYAVSYAMSDAPSGAVGPRGASWREAMDAGGPSFLLRGRPGVVSPGHTSVVPGPNNVDLYLAYHAVLPGSAERRPCLDRLFWHGDRPWTAGPTDDPQPAPALPRWRDLYDRTQATLDPSWTPSGGVWRVAAGVATQGERSAAVATLRQRAPLGPAWHLELNLRRTSGEGRYGLELRDAAGSAVRITIEPAALLVVRTERAGAERLAVAELPPGFEREAWHQLIVTYAGSVLNLQLDALPLTACMVAGLADSVALLTDRCGAEFAGLALTDHFRDEFLDEHYSPEALGWVTETAREGRGQDCPEPVWRLLDGALEQVVPSAGRCVALKGPALEAFEAGATVRLRGAAPHDEAGFGLVVRHPAGGQLLIMLAQDAGAWVLRAAQRGSPHAPDLVRALSPAFDAAAWHTLSVRYGRRQAEISLDGAAMISVPTPAGAARFGLVSQNIAAAFTSVWCTGTQAP